jgi:hypothetical protein
MMQKKASDSAGDIAVVAQYTAARPASGDSCSRPLQFCTIRELAVRAVGFRDLSIWNVLTERRTK